MSISQKELNYFRFWTIFALFSIGSRIQALHRPHELLIVEDAARYSVCGLFFAVSLEKSIKREYQFFYVPKKTTVILLQPLSISFPVILAILSP